MIECKLKQIEALSSKATEIGLTTKDVEFKVKHGAINVQIVELSDNPKIKELKNYNYIKVQK